MVGRVGGYPKMLLVRGCLKSSQCISTTCCMLGRVDNTLYPFNRYGFKNPKKVLNGRSPSCEEQCPGVTIPVQCDMFLCEIK